MQRPMDKNKENENKPPIPPIDNGKKKSSKEKPTIKDDEKEKKKINEEEREKKKLELLNKIKNKNKDIFTGDDIEKMPEIKQTININNKKDEPKENIKKEEKLTKEEIKRKKKEEKEAKKREEKAKKEQEKAKKCQTMQKH